MSDDILIERKQRTRTYKRVIAGIVIFGGAYLLWSLKPLILPIVFGILLAYICLPLTERLQRNGIPKSISVLMLVVFIFFLLFYSFVFIKNQLPDTNEQIRLRVVALYQLNERYQDFMDLSNPEAPSNSLIYRLIGFETNPIMDSINSFLALKKSERRQFEEAFPITDQSDDTNHHIWSLQLSNEQLGLYSEAGLLYENLGDSEKGLTQPLEQRSSNISLIMSVFSTWLIMPIIFFFFLLDDGQLKKNLMRLVPNMYFEMALTSLKNVDKAIGMYLRGTILETLAVFISFLILLPIIGFNPTATVLIGLAAAILNIIPIIGSIAGIILCMMYTLVIEDVNSILPFINQSNLIVAAALIALFVQLLDNTIFKPYVLGNAVDLHPLVVVISVIGGAIMFGFWGILFAIPLIVILKVTVLTILKQMKQYQIVDP